MTRCLLAAPPPLPQTEMVNQLLGTFDQEVRMSHASRRLARQSMVLRMPRGRRIVNRLLLMMRFSRTVPNQFVLQAPTSVESLRVRTWRTGQNPGSNLPLICAKPKDKKCVFIPKIGDTNYQAACLHSKCGDQPIRSSYPIQ